VSPAVVNIVTTTIDFDFFFNANKTDKAQKNV
jgi:hypothetical protein